MVRPLDYSTQLSLEEAEERLTDIGREFNRVKSHYSGLIGMFKKNMGKRDQEVLADCMGVLLPLSMQRSVQEQIGHLDDEGTVSHQINENLGEIGMYLARFGNTGVTILEGSIFP